VIFALNDFKKTQNYYPSKPEELSPQFISHLPSPDEDERICFQSNKKKWELKVFSNKRNIEGIYIARSDCVFNATEKNMIIRVVHVYWHVFSKNRGDLGNLARCNGNSID